MKKLALMAVAAALFAAALPATASAGSDIKRLARAECKEDKVTEAAEFSALYGGTGKAAMTRCIKAQRSDARAECKQDRRTEPAEFAAEYRGTSNAAIKRCMRDELT
jgi:hypothetical protein